MKGALLTIDQAARALGVSRSTLFRRIRAGKLRTVRRSGRRLVPRDALERVAPPDEPQPLTDAHPLWRLVGAYRGDPASPGARDKHAVLDE